MALVRLSAISFVIALAAVSAAAQSSAPGLNGISAVQLMVLPVDDEARQCGISDDGLDAAVRIPVSNTQLKAVADSPFSLYVQTTTAPRKGTTDCTTMIQVSALRRAWFSPNPEAKAGMVAVWTKSALLSGTASTHGRRTYEAIEGLTKQFIGAWLRENN
jgi:hypothetical protein